jgi:hypothetical protein
MLNFTGLESLIEKHLGNMAVEASSILQQSLAQVGTGKHHIQNPNRSSTEGEYPSHQTDALQHSIGFEQVSYSEFFFGPIHDPPEYTEELHNAPPESGGRPFMEMALHDQGLHAHVMQAAVI